MGNINSRRLQQVAFAVMAVSLLGMTLAWRVPMMLWDHLDLPPIYQAWRDGHLAASGFWQVHDGSHLHTVAYAVLLLTTYLSHGQTWLDCVVSWALLLVYAFCVLKMARLSFASEAPWRWGWVAIVLLALYPGHLANLQWGWQVAVFLCLAGAGICILLISTGAMKWWRNVLALVAAMVACLSFTTGLALVPVALLVIGLRRELTVGARLAYMLPWLVLGAWVALRYGGAAGNSAGVGALVAYVLNFIGAGVLRFASDIAGWLAVVAIIVACLCLPVAWRKPQALPWLALMVFGLGSALLTAMGRAAPFGSEHAFVTRYVSFSSTFWLGWFGLLWVSAGGQGEVLRKWLRRLACVVLVFAAANALHLVKKAASVAEKSGETGARICASWPQVDEGLLGEIYFGRVEPARARLQYLQAQGFAPFPCKPRGPQR